tara:strand:- start:270 stop:479 length:210 start_codon:yes stop_codon:yes gene_type:complete
VFNSLIKAVESRIGPPVAEPVLVPTVVNLQNISATKLRDAIAINDLETIEEMIPSNVKVEDYIKILRNK